MHRTRQSASIYLWRYSTSASISDDVPTFLHAPVSSFGRLLLLVLLFCPSIWASVLPIVCRLDLVAPSLCQAHGGISAADISGNMSPHCSPATLVPYKFLFLLVHLVGVPTGDP